MQVFTWITYQFNTSLINTIIIIFSQKEKRILTPNFWAVVYKVTKDFYFK